MILAPSVLVDIFSVIPTSLDEGEGGYLELHSGAMPNNFVPKSDTLLAKLKFDNPSIKSLSDTLLELLPPQEAVALVTGDAEWARLTKHDGYVLANLTVSAYGGNGDVIIEASTPTLYEGGLFTIQSISFTFA